jgi:hypothetical protein
LHEDIRPVETEIVPAVFFGDEYSGEIPAIDGRSTTDMAIIFRSSNMEREGANAAADHYFESCSLSVLTLYNSRVPEGPVIRGPLNPE